MTRFVRGLYGRRVSKRTTVREEERSSLPDGRPRIPPPRLERYRTSDPVPLPPVLNIPEAGHILDVLILLTSPLR